MDTITGSVKRIGHLALFITGILVVIVWSMFAWVASGIGRLTRPR